MTRHPQRLPDYLRHIVEAIERIGRYTTLLDETAFMQNEMVQDAVIRNLEVIGEASRNIARDHPEFTASHPELPLSPAYEMRNALSHGYFSVDLHIVWRTVVRHLPVVHSQVTALLKQAEPDDIQG